MTGHSVLCQISQPVRTELVQTVERHSAAAERTIGIALHPGARHSLNVLVFCLGHRFRLPCVGIHAVSPYPSASHRVLTLFFFLSSLRGDYGSSGWYANP